jgi:adenine-specific DNA-methyltransferase
MADKHTPLRATLGGTILDWSGRKAIGAILSRLKPRILATLPPDIDPSFGDGPGRDRNLILEGDNLQALASLPKYLGKVDFIYADPPYNTGEEFRYNDKWDEDPNDTSLGPVVLVTDTQRHAKWVSFMLPRLEMMKRFLKPGGVIAVSIDDREHARLRLLMDQVFGEGNYLSTVNWQKVYSPKSNVRHITSATEYVLVYANREDLASTGLLGRTGVMDARYKNIDNDPQGVWAGDNPTAWVGNKQSANIYGIQSPFTGEVHYPPQSAAWRRKKSDVKVWLEEWGSEYQEAVDATTGNPALLIVGDIAAARVRAEARLAQGTWPTLYFLDGGKGRPRVKRYLADVKAGRVAMSYLPEEDYRDPEELGSVQWDHEQSGHSEAGKKLLNAIMGDHGFDTPKPLKLIKTLVQLWCPPQGIVLDPFAGSGTTAHAVLELNAETGTDRSFLLVEPGQPEEIQDDGTADLFARTLTAERIRRVITGEWADGKEHEPLGGGFTFKTVGQQINREALGSMERNEIIDVIAQIEAGRDPRGFRLEEVGEGFKHLVGRNRSGAAVALVYEGADASVFDEKAAGEVYAEAEKLGMTPPPAIRVYARKKLWADSDFEFRQIPDQILIDLGLEDEADLPEGA